MTVLTRTLPMIALSVAVLSACANPFRAYRIDIVQGQSLTQEQVAQVRAGMTPAQVRFILGTPLVTDTLSPTRWDYPFRFLPGTDAARAGLSTVPSRRVSVFFEGGLVSEVRVEGELPERTASLPASRDGAVRSSNNALQEEAR